MITICRALAQQLRAVFRRVNGSSSRTPVGLRFLASADGLRIQAVHEQFAVEYWLAEPQEPAEFAAPLDLLAACEGKSQHDLVYLRTTPAGQTIAEWDDRGIPQQQWFDPSPQSLPPFPPAPAQTTVNESGFLAALDAAAATADAASSRYALGCLNLRGSTGSIAATDGGQLLVQQGWQFPWTGDRLVPATSIFGCRQLPLEQSVRVGETGDWISIGVGPWTICLRIDRAGHFPKVDDLVRPAATAKSRLTLTAADARFALDALQRMPTNRDEGSPVTLDLNGEVMIRARPDRQTSPVELVLTNSRVVGEPVRLVSSCRYLSRALALGFTEFLLFGPDGTLQASDERRSYLWMPFSDEHTVAADNAARRITSPAPDSGPRQRKRNGRRLQKHSPAAVHNRQTGAAPAESALSPAKNSPAKNSPVEHARVEHSTAEHDSTERCRVDDCPTQQTPLEQVLRLRASVKQVLAQTNELLCTLKRQRKTSRLVETTLNSLRQLQPVV